MKAFIYEFVAGGGFLSLAAAPPASLLSEGTAMLQALVADFARLNGATTTYLRDARFSQSDDAGAILVRDAQAHDAAFARAAAEADWTVVIAPEFDGLLHAACCRVLEQGGTLLGPTPDWIALAADKQRTAERLLAVGVPTLTGLALATDQRLPSDFPYPAVLKRRDGAGSLDMRLIPDAAAAAQFGGAPFAARLEPWHAGRPASVAVLAGGKRLVPLQPCWQYLSDDGAFVYRGGSLIEDGALVARAVRLATAAIAALGEVRGYIGVDLLLDVKERNDCVVEINPRLTTSYIGLRRAYDANLAGVLCRLAAGEAVEAPCVRRQVAFTADGAVELGAPCLP